MGDDGGGSAFAGAGGEVRVFRGGSRRPRRSIVLSVLLLGGVFIWLALMPVGGIAATMGGGCTATVMSAVAGAACLRAGRRGAGADRVGWSLLGAGMFCWTVADTIWLSFVLLDVFPGPFPSVADIGFLLLVPLSIAGVFALARLGRSGIRVLLDGFIISGSLLVVSWVTVLGPIFAADGQDGFVQAVALAYPMGDVAIASMVFIVLGHSERHNRSALALVGLGMLGFAIADSGFVYLSQFGQWNPSAVGNVGWIVGFMLIAYGAGRARTVPAVAGQRLAWVWLALPYVPLSIAVGSSVALEIVHGGVGPLVLVLITLLVVFVVLRQIVALRDNLVLTGNLQSMVMDLQNREEQLRFLAFHDPLTGLPNRALFQDRLAQALLVRLRTPAPVAVLYIDLDGFKEINDCLGHAAGDSALVSVAEQLRTCMRSGDTAARLGGDEFAMLVDSVPLSGIIRVAERIVEQVIAGIVIDGRPVQLGASVGVAFHESGDIHAGDLLRRADLAMYAAKLQGKSRYVLFEPHLRDGIDAGLPA
jgi:diguanylate cyclase (GGDEF)-like protein